MWCQANQIWRALEKICSFDLRDIMIGIVPIFFKLSNVVSIMQFSSCEFHSVFRNGTALLWNFFLHLVRTGCHEQFFNCEILLYVRFLFFFFFFYGTLYLKRRLIYACVSMLSPYCEEEVACKMSPKLWFSFIFTLGRIYDKTLKFKCFSICYIFKLQGSVNQLPYNLAIDLFA
jgi:hypothetical protein